MKTYLCVGAGLPLLLVGGVAAINYTVDPFLIHQWGTPRMQRLRQPVEKLNAWGKTYAMAVYRPESIYLGNSRTELGLAVAPQGAERVFNAALSGATVGDALRMLGHARELAPLRRVVWGLDAPSFTLSAGNTELEMGLLAQDERYLARRVLMDLQRSVSIDMSRASLDLLAGRVPAICRASLAQFGQRDGACIRHRIEGWGGAAEVAGPRTREFLRGEGPAEGPFVALEQAMRRDCAVHWRLYVNPTHAMTIDALYWSGRGRQYEQWLTRLADLGQRVRAAGCDVRIYDFSGFNAITTEPVPRSGDRREMQYYWETSHYRDTVGAAILARVAGAPPAPDGFGAELATETMAARISQLRSARASYLASHPYEAELAQRIARAHAAGR